MAFKTNRQESLPNHSGHTFRVGEGCHWGFNGDRYPGTVVRVSDSGRKVYVIKDDFKVVDGKQGFIEGDRECVFIAGWTMVENFQEKLAAALKSKLIGFALAPLGVSEYTLRKSGHFHVGRSSGVAWSLQGERRYAQNPSF
jgi:hypothetical protein